MSYPPRPLRLSLDQIEDYARRGVNWTQIAGLLGLSTSGLALKRKADPRIDEVFERGKSKGIVAVASVLYDAAISGNDLASTRFYLERRGGWKDTGANTPTGNVNIVQNNLYTDKVELIMTMQRLIASGVDPEAWPKEVRVIAGLDDCEE